MFTSPQTRPLCIVLTVGICSLQTNLAKKLKKTIYRLDYTQMFNIIGVIDALYIKVGEPI